MLPPKYSLTVDPGPSLHVGKHCEADARHLVTNNSDEMSDGTLAAISKFRWTRFPVRLTHLLRNLNVLENSALPIELIDQ